MATLSINEGMDIGTFGFESYNVSTVHYLLHNIHLRTSLMGNYQNRHLPHILIKSWTGGNPKCCNAGDERIILLTTKENYWCQWIYQFSHEICHHIIDGPMTGEIRGQLWFEETLCELNSMYQLLQVFHVDCRQHPLLQHYAPSVQDYLNDLTRSNPDLLQSLREGGLRQWLPLLSEPQYHRSHYNAVACLILPLFVENPRLWGILSHIGDSRSYATIDDLFAHLRATADDSYRESLEKMIALLLP